MRTTKKASPRSTSFLYFAIALLLIVAAVFVLVTYALPAFFSVSYAENATSTVSVKNPPTRPVLNAADYDKRLLALAHVATSSPWYHAFLAGTTTITLPGATSSITVAKKAWPVKTEYPLGGALLPFNRIVAYYGNFYSKQMGILGEFEESVVLEKLRAQVAEWEAADPSTPVIPAIEYIDVTAQGSAGKDGKYRLRMPDSQIDKAIEMAKKINGIVILDIQVGLSNLESELPLLTDYLKLPQVHLAIDPEFAMHNGTPPGRVIGTMDATDINYASDFLAKLVRQYELPPKILVVHRFTQDMVTGYKRINTSPEVQVVMQMDGWGHAARKINTYNAVINPEPVQFTGFKIFYKNDLKEDPPRLMTPAEVLKLTPSPSFIQYQ